MATLWSYSSGTGGQNCQNGHSWWQSKLNKLCNHKSMFWQFLQWRVFTLFRLLTIPKCFSTEQQICLLDRMAIGVNKNKKNSINTIFRKIYLQSTQLGNLAFSYFFAKRSRLLSDFILFMFCKSASYYFFIYLLFLPFSFCNQINFSQQIILMACLTPK